MRDPLLSSLIGICLIVPIFILVSCKQVDLQSNLVAYYPFDGNANDMSGNNLNGIVQGAALSSDRNNKANSAYEFSKNEDVISVAHNELLNIIDSLTLSVWINLDSSNQWGSRIIDKIERGTANGFLLDIFNLKSTSKNHIETVRFTGREGFTNVSAKEISLKEWNHVAITYARGQVNIYINGRLVKRTKEQETGLITNTEKLEIGNDLYGNGQNLYDPFRGKIDEVRIYSRTLSTNEIKSLMNLE